MKDTERLMTGEEFEKAFAVRHYMDAAGQAQVDRRREDRRQVESEIVRCNCDSQLHYVCSRHWTSPE